MSCLPVALRRGGRSLGGSLSWSTPQPLAPFEATSPFRGLAVPDDVKVNRQVLADPTVATESQVWARLADGTPLVTASRKGEGWIVLFHVTANSDWSNLPLSGLFVEMLRRAVNMGPSKVDVSSGDQAQAGTAGPKSRKPEPSPRQARCRRSRRSTAIGQLGSPPAARSAHRVRQDRHARSRAPSIRLAITALRVRRAPSTSSPPRPCSSRSSPSRASAQVSGYVMRKPVALEPWLYLAVLGTVRPRRSCRVAA